MSQPNQAYPTGGRRYGSQSNLVAKPEGGGYPQHQGSRPEQSPGGYPSAPRGHYPTSDNRRNEPPKHDPGAGGRTPQSGYPSKQGYPEKSPVPKSGSTSGYPSDARSKERNMSSSNPNSEKGYQYPSAQRNGGTHPNGAYTNPAYAASRENLAPKSPSQHDVSAAKHYPGYPATNSQGTPTPLPPTRKQGRPSESRSQGSSSSAPYSPTSKSAPGPQTPSTPVPPQGQYPSGGYPSRGAPPRTPTSPQGSYPQPTREGYPSKRAAPSSPPPYPQPSPAYSMPNIAQQSSGMKYMSMSDLNQALDAPAKAPQAAPITHAQSLSALAAPQSPTQPVSKYPVVSNQPISSSPDGKSPKTPKSDEGGNKEGPLDGIKRKFRFQKNKNAQAQSRPTSTLSAAHLAQNAQLQRYGSRLSVSSAQAGTLNSQQGSQWSLNTLGDGTVEGGGMKRSASMYSVASIRTVTIPRCGSFISLTTATGETKIMATDTFESCFIPALVTAILCFFPTGIVAALYAKQAKDSYESGDVVEGRRKAEMAKLLVIITVCIGMLCWIVGIIALVLVIAT